jgi:hypothetical protein
VNTIKVTGNVDENHQLSVRVPAAIPPGPVMILVVPLSQEDEPGSAWTAGIAQQWTDELGDPDQDIYTLADGEPESWSKS